MHKPVRTSLIKNEKKKNKMKGYESFFVLESRASVVIDGTQFFLMRCRLGHMAQVATLLRRFILILIFLVIEYLFFNFIS
jgi:hypothetical protein